ncbi:MAG: MarR family transcriptional regulator [Spirochaetes bacterium]|nr:MarR family transcriptional regulator [Spirochaetota bacterium]
MKKTFTRGKHIGFLIKRIQHEMQKRMDVELWRLKLTTPQYSALNQLEEHPGLSNAELARKSFLTPQTMNQIILTLEKKNCIERSKHPVNARIQEIYLSDKGKQILHEAHTIVSNVEENLFKNLTDKEKTELTGFLEKVKIDS